MYAIPQKIYHITKRLQTSEEVEKYFPGFMAFTDLQTTDTTTYNKSRRKMVLFFRQEEKTY